MGTPPNDRCESTSAAESIISTDAHVHRHDTTSKTVPVTTPHDLKNDGRDSAPAPITQLVRFIAASFQVTVPGSGAPPLPSSPLLP